MEPSLEIKNVVLSLYASLSRRDMGALEKLYSQHDRLLVIGTDPDEWWEGYETFARVHKAQFQEMSETYTIEAGELNAFAGGTTGWASDRATIQLSGGHKLPIRVTCVFHREEGAWKIVQHHVSLGTSNLEAFRKEFTVE